MTHSLRSFNSPSNHVITKLNTVHCANLDELENFCRHVIAQRDSFTLTRSMQNQGIVKDRANFSAYCCSYTCGSKATKLQAWCMGMLTLAQNAMLASTLVQSWQLKVVQSTLFCQYEADTLFLTVHVHIVVWNILTSRIGGCMRPLTLIKC